MNWKVILVGGIAYLAAQWLVSFATGPLVHEGVLVEAYQANAAFWRPELNEVPPNMVALLPLWITTGLIVSFVSAAIYMWIRPSLAGAGWQRGLKFGFISLLFHGSYILGWSGVFNLPNQIWMWWWLESMVYLLVGGAALGWVAQKLAPAKN